MDEYERLTINDDSHFSNAFQALNIFRENGEFCDVIIQTDNGVKVTAHKVVLGACSPYFRAMFTTDFLEARQPIIELKDVDGHALQDIVDYFYLGKLDINYLNVESVIKLANVLQIGDLNKKCEVFLRRNMSYINSLGLQAFAQHHSLDNLKEHAMRYSCWYFDYVKETEEFLLLPIKCLIQLVENDSLRAPSEEFIFEAVIKWLMYDYNNRKLHIDKLIPHIRFPLMSINYLCESDTIKSLTLNFSLGQYYIKEAIQYHQNRECKFDNIMKQCTPRVASEDIYVIGGWSNGQKMSTVQCFNVDTLKWASVNNMTVAHVAKEDYFRVIVSNEELYTICFDKVMNYDPVDRIWCKVASGPEIQCKWAGVCEYNGIVYVVGGNTLRISKSFDTETCQWKDLPLMNHARYYPAVAVLNGKVYVIGGLDNRWYPLRYCECFDPLTNTWKNIARMRSPRWSLGVAVLDNKIFAIGGSHNVEQFANTVEVYDPELDFWERSIAPLNFGRRCFGVAVVNDSIYVVGGRVVNTIECYNKELNAWKVVGSVQTCCNFGCVALRII